MKATWKGQVLAESDDTVVVEGNHYFPAGALRRERFRESATHTVCPWKGTASYYDVVVGDDVNRDAAWYYPAPKPAAANITGRVAFWKGVQVSALAALLLFAARPAVALEDLTGTWQGKATCEAIDGGVIGKSSEDVTMHVQDAGAGVVGLMIPGLTTWFGRYVVDAGDSDHAVVSGMSCDVDEDDVEGAVLRGHVTTKAGSTKASFTGTAILVDGPAGESLRCDLKLKRTAPIGLTPNCPL